MREHSKGGTAFRVKMFIGVMCVMLVLIIVGAFSIMCNGQTNVEVFNDDGIACIKLNRTKQVCKLLDKNGKYLTYKEYKDDQNKKKTQHEFVTYKVNNLVAVTDTATGNTYISFDKSKGYIKSSGNIAVMYDSNEKDVFDSAKKKKVEDTETKVEDAERK